MYGVVDHRVVRMAARVVVAVTDLFGSNRRLGCRFTECVNHISVIAIRQFRFIFVCVFVCFVKGSLFL